MTLEAIAGDEEDDDDAEDDEQHAHDVHENMLGVQVSVEVLGFFTTKNQSNTTSLQGSTHTLQSLRAPRARPQAHSEALIHYSRNVDRCAHTLQS